MKFTITLKDPDGFSEGVDEAVRDSLASVPVTDKEKDVLHDTRCETVWEALEKWVDCQEYVTLEFDTEAGTAVVVRRNR